MQLRVKALVLVALALGPITSGGSPVYQTLAGKAPDYSFHYDTIPVNSAQNSWNQSNSDCMWAGYGGINDCASAPVESQLADSVTLDGRGQLRRLTFWGYYDNGVGTSDTDFSPAGSFDILFFRQTDSDLFPFVKPETEAFHTQSTGTINGVLADTRTVYDITYSVFEWTVDLQPMTFPTDETFWMSIRSNQQFDGDNFFHWTYSVDLNQPAAYQRNGNDNEWWPWALDRNSFAYQLDGLPLPEPGTLGLLGLGLLGLGFTRRRKA